MFLLFENIDHRQRDHDRNTELEHLHHKIQVALKIGRVHHGNYRIWF